MDGGGAAGGEPLGLRLGLHVVLGWLLPMDTPLGDIPKVVLELLGTGGGPPGKDWPG